LLVPGKDFVFGGYKFHVVHLYSIFVGGEKKGKIFSRENLVRILLGTGLRLALKQRGHY
jgi:hypothetical protein